MFARARDSRKSSISVNCNYYSWLVLFVNSILFDTAYSCMNVVGSDTGKSSFYAVAKIKDTAARIFILLASESVNLTIGGATVKSEHFGVGTV